MDRGQSTLKVERQGDRPRQHVFKNVRLDNLVVKDQYIIYSLTKLQLRGEDEVGKEKLRPKSYFQREVGRGYLQDVIITAATSFAGDIETVFDTT